MRRARNLFTVGQSDKNYCQQVAFYGRLRFYTCEAADDQHDVDLTGRRARKNDNSLMGLEMTFAAFTGRTAAGEVSRNVESVASEWRTRE